MDNKEKILSVRDLTVSFRTNQGMVRAVRGVSFDLYKGETLAIVGESGSGKSVTSRAIMGILPGNGIIDKGSIIFEGQDLTKLTEEEFVKLRGDKIGMIFQDPMSSLNPIMRVGKQITEAILVNGNRLKKRLEEYCQKEQVAYANVRRERNQLIEEFNKKKEKLKAEKKKEELAALTETFKKELAQINEQLKVAKAEFKAKRKEGKQKIKNDWKQEKRKVKQQIKDRKEYYRLNPIPVDEINVQIEQLKKQLEDYKKNTYEAAINTLNKQWEERKKKTNQQIQELKAKANGNRHEVHLDIQQLKADLLEYEDSVYKKTLRKIKREFKAEKERIKKEIRILKEKKNPLRKEIKELKENLRRYKKVTKKEAKERAIKVLEEVGIPEPEKRLKQYPFQFSGGMRQRIVIAIALMGDPDILICDEPTTALDVTIQAQILELIKKLKEERNLSVIFITHDLGVVANMADRVAVMYAGKIVEIGTVNEIFYDPRHPYTWALLSSMPDLDTKERLNAIPGTPPDMLFPPKGDAFAERNPYAMKIDFEKEPPFFKISDTHYAATWLLHEKAPKVELPKILQERYKRRKVEGVNQE